MTRETNTAKFIYFKSTNEIFKKFDNYEIWPCLIVGKTDTGSIIYETCDFDDPDIAKWCVYGHFRTGGLECISDHDTIGEAEEFEGTLPVLNFQR